ncbi:MAG: hypothetical protein V7L21_34665 [Nostoc sp.]|uniref:hypothetical protein n=1 Tax=unclassified Nostoc TaxID=2593658 RepID=UPI0025F3C97D|nr:hypothetical protein [Nostoc sp. NMS9]MBN3941755.1 hypothetical protein [Nostoc sp. NMS9]
MYSVKSHYHIIKIVSSKIRKQIYIKPHQEHLLKAIAQIVGISEAEIIRQAIDPIKKF